VEQTHRKGIEEEQPLYGEALELQHRLKGERVGQLISLTAIHFLIPESSD